MEKIYTIKCLGGFRDGNVLPEPVKPGKVMEVNEALWKRIKQSDPDAFEVMETTIKVPPPTKAKKDAKD